MSTWRDIRRQGRRDVHHHMRVPAVYLPSPEQAGRRVDVRLHVRFPDVEVQQPGGIVARDTAPRAVFDRTEVAKPNTRGGILAVSPVEIYKLALARPVDGDFVTIEVSPLSADECAARWRPEWEALLQ